MGRSVLALVLFLLGVPLARADGGYRVPAPTSATPVESLPPGLWFRANRYEDFALENEPAQAPRYAAIAGVFTNASTATQAAARVRRVRVALGFPWAVANHDLHVAGRCREAAVVVAGLFVSESDARAWRGQDPSRAALQLVRLEQPDDPRACPWGIDDSGTDVDDRGRHLDVIQIDPARPAPAISTGELDRLTHEREVRSVPTDEVERWISRMPSVCTVPAGSVHLFREHRAMYRYGWRFAPVRCAGRTAYVPVERTMRSIVVERRPDGESRLHQITDVTCDSASFDVWRYTFDGRIVIPESPPTFTAACGDRS